MVVEDDRNGVGFGDKGRKNQCWYDVEDMVEGKGTGGEKDQLGEVDDEGNGGGVGCKKGLKGNKGRENHYGWDFMFSEEEEGQLVVEGKYIFFHNRGSVFSQWVRF